MTWGRTFRRAHETARPLARAVAAALALGTALAPLPYSAHAASGSAYQVDDRTAYMLVVFTPSYADPRYRRMRDSFTAIEALWRASGAMFVGFAPDAAPDAVGGAIPTGLTPQSLARARKAGDFQVLLLSRGWRVLHSSTGEVHRAVLLAEMDVGHREQPTIVRRRGSAKARIEAREPTRATLAALPDNGPTPRTRPVMVAASEAITTAASGAPAGDLAAAAIVEPTPVTPEPVPPAERDDDRIERTGPVDETPTLEWAEGREAGTEATIQVSGAVGAPDRRVTPRVPTPVAATAAATGTDTVVDQTPTEPFDAPIATTPAEPQAEVAGELEASEPRKPDPWAKWLGREDETPPQDPDPDLENGAESLLAELRAAETATEDPGGLVPGVLHTEGSGPALEAEAASAEAIPATDPIETTSVDPIAPVPEAASELGGFPPFEALLDPLLPGDTLERAKLRAIDHRLAEARLHDEFEERQLDPALPIATRLRMRFDHGAPPDSMNRLSLGPMLLVTGSCGALPPHEGEPVDDQFTASVRRDEPRGFFARIFGG